MRPLLAPRWKKALFVNIYDYHERHLVFLFRQKCIFNPLSVLGNEQVRRFNHHNPNPTQTQASPQHDDEQSGQNFFSVSHRGESRDDIRSPCSQEGTNLPSRDHQGTVVELVPGQNQPHFSEPTSTTSVNGHHHYRSRSSRIHSSGSSLGKKKLSLL